MGAEQQKLALPKQELPALNLHTDEAPAPAMSLSSRKAELDDTSDKTGAKKSANWLLDAMDEKKSDKGKSFGGDLQADDELQRNEKRAPERADKNPATEKRRAAEAPNPLTNFMAEWMTPGDFELLKAKPDAGASLGGEKLLAPVGGGAAASSQTPAALAGISDSANGSSRIGEALSLPKENPYLAGLTAPTPPPVAVPEIMRPPAGTTPVAPPAMELQPAAKTSSNQSDVLKPQDDAKYFKQLNRF